MTDVFVEPSGEMRTDELFFDVHKEDIESVFHTLEVADLWVDDLDEIVEQTQPWTHGDHSRPGEGAKRDLTEEQVDALYDHYVRLGLVQERVLPAGEVFDEIIVFGAIHRGNMRRLDYLARMREAGVQAHKVTLLAGQRRPFEEREALEVKVNVAEILDQGGANEWAETFLEKPLDQRWETDLMRLAAYAKLGDLTLKRLDLALGDEDPIKKYLFDWHGIPLALNHSRAVERPNGDKRHNTDSVVRDWVRDVRVPQGARVGVVTANPHLDRMARATAAILREQGREDIRLYPGGPAIPVILRETIPLGEIARHLYEDQRLLRDAPSARLLR